MIQSTPQAKDVTRAMPFAMGVEKSVMSILMNDIRLKDEVSFLTAEHFYLPSHQVIFTLLEEIAAAHKSVDLVSMVQTLLDRGELDRVGGPAAVTDIWGYSLSSEPLQHHAAILLRKHARRLTIKTANEMIAVAYECAEEEEIIAATSAPITEIHEAITGTAAAPSKGAVLTECVNEFAALCAGQVTPMGIETSIPCINAMFHGLHRKETVVISGYPSGGKTTLAGQFAADSMLAGHNTLILSLEMPAKKLMQRIIAYVARRPGMAVTNPLGYTREKNPEAEGASKEVMMAVRAAIERIAKAPFNIEDFAGANVMQLVSCIRRAHRKNPLELVVIDFAQRITAAPGMARETREQQLSHAANYMADVAKELDFCLILPSQLNKDGSAKHAEAINEAADLHLTILQDRTAKKDGTPASMEHIGLTVPKDRHHGQIGAFLPVVLDGPNVRFVTKAFENEK